VAKNLPSVTSPLPRDLQQFIQRVRESLDGGGLDAAVTTRQLIGSGLISGTAGVALIPPSGSVQPPRPPSNLAATGALASIIVSWSSANYSGHAYTEIWAHSSDLIGDAQLVGMTAGNNFSHQLGTAATRYYWVRNVNRNGVTSAYNATNGVQATTSTDPAYVLSILTNEITASELHSDLGARIDLVDGSVTLPNSVAAKIAAEATARASAISTETTNRATAIANEATARQNAIDALAASVADITGAEAYDNTATYAVGDLVVYNDKLYSAKQTSTGNLPTATAYWDLVGSYSSIGEIVVANAGAISAIDTRVSNTEGVNTSQATSITNLNTNIATANTNVANNASAISGLSTRVTTAEGNITSQASSITSLNATVAGHTSGLAINTSALSSLGTRVSATETSISSQSGQITSLQTSIADITGVSAYVASASYATGDFVEYNSKLYEAKQATTGNIPTNTTYWELLGDFTSITGLVSANTAAVSSLDTRVTSAEGTISSQASSLTSLTTTSASQGVTLAANTSAISGLDTRVTTAEGTVSTHTSDITSLTTSVGTASSGVSANATAISGLDTRVTTAEGTLTNHASDITALEVDMNSTELATAANASALTTLDTRVTTTEAGITSNSNAITTLNSEMTATETATTANANAVAGLDTRVTSAEGSITTNASAITTLNTGLASANTNVATNASAVTALDTRVTSAEGSITTNATNITSLNTEMTATETATTANTSAVSALDTRVTSAEGSITSNANSITSLNTSLTNSNTNISSNASALTALDTRVTSAEGSITSTASSLTQLTTTVGGNTTSISTNASSINGIEGKFTVKIDTAGHVSGYGLISTANDGTPTSEFGVRADTFWVSPPSNASASAPTSGLYKGYVWYDSSNNVTKYYTGSAFSTTPQTVPFVIKSTSGTVNGVTVPAGVYMDTAMIADATISNAQIGSLTADKITTSLLSTVDFYGNKIAGSTIYLGGTVNYTTSGGSNVGISSVSSPNVVLDTNGATFNVDAFRVNNLNSGAYETPFQVVNNHVYIKGANIEDASITNAKIGDVIQSDNYNAGSAGWKINKAGEMEMNNATFRGTLDVANASSGQRLAIDGDSIKVFDANNTLRVQIGDLS